MIVVASSRKRCTKSSSPCEDKWCESVEFLIFHCARQVQAIARRWFYDRFYIFHSNKYLIQISPHIFLTKYLSVLLVFICSEWTCSHVLIMHIISSAKRSVCATEWGTGDTNFYQKRDAMHILYIFVFLYSLLFSFYIQSFCLWNAFCTISSMLLGIGTFSNKGRWWWWQAQPWVPCNYKIEKIQITPEIFWDLIEASIF